MRPARCGSLTGRPGGLPGLGLDRSLRGLLRRLAEALATAAALLSTLAGIALGYIALGFLLRTHAQPWWG